MWKQSTLLIFCVCVTSLLGQEISRKICSDNPSSSECQQLARSGEVACNYNFHNVDCLLNIQSNTSHLGRIKGNQALLGANLLSENVVVLGEIRSGHPPAQTVVIVKSNIANGFINLKGKKFCHPGYTNDLAFPHFMFKEFEDKIIELESPVCNDNITLLERHISTLSTFFAESCKPGPWSQNIKEHEKLQNRYSSLCALCGNSKCDVVYSKPFNDSLKCLLNNQADVAITTLYEAQQFFQHSTNAQNYKFFCKDGSSSSNSVPCIWSSTLPDLLVAERTVASYMEDFLRTNLKSKINSTKVPASEGTAGEVLTRILSLTSRRENIAFLEQYSDYRSLKQYVADNENVSVPIPLNNIQCSRTLKWCTINDSEQQKCKWLSQASVNWGIQPQVECVQSGGSDELSCLDDIKMRTADIVVASSDYAYVSFKKGLTSVAFPETDSRNLSLILAVKKNDNAIQTFQDMEGKRACIPRFGGKEHLAFIDTLRNKNLFDGQNCDYGQLLTNFVGSSCVPGVRSSLVRESSDSVDKDKLCEQCVPINSSTPTSEYCNADAINKYYGDAGALDCLFDQIADFAIVTKPVSANDTDLRVICKNNTVSSVVGLNVDRECALAVLPNSEIVALINNTKIRDIKLALFEFEKWFGQYLEKSFHLFDRFNDTTDLLFLDTTPGLDIDNEIANIEEYKNLLKNVKDCNVNGNAATSIGITLEVLCIVFAHIILNKLF